MTKKAFAACLLIFFSLTTAFVKAQEVYSLGLFTGISVPYTWDGGINSDPRYRDRFDIKFSPIGVHYGVDKEGYGIMVDPTLIRIGQNFNILNTTGGEIGLRRIDLTYVQVPISLKLHIIDMSFFKVSFVGGISAGFLLNGKESIRHTTGKLDFPKAITGEPGSAEAEAFKATYPQFVEEVEYDGVVVRNVNAGLYDTKDFQKFQFFGSLGFRSDWDFSENWRASFDLRGNIGILDPRAANRIDRIKNYEAPYDMYGSRRDLFLSLTFGIARTLTIENRERQAKQKKHGENKPRRPAKYPWPKPRSKKPKG